ncbi:MAG: lysylphosphatidylglycerol synthase transmembrane domain-containing protein [Alphaproteobacteria bacterium]
MGKKLKQFNIESVARYKRVAVNTTVVVLACVVLGVALMGGRTFWEHVMAVPPMVLVVLAVASVHENWVRIYRYKIFSRALNLHVPWPRMVLYYVAGMALLPTPGKVGVVLRLWLLHHHHNIPYRRSAPLLMMDVMTDTLAMMVLIGVGMVSMGHVHSAALGLMILSGVMVGIFTVLALPKVAIRGIKLLYWMVGKRAPRLFATLMTLVMLLHKLMGWRVLISCTLLSLMAWAGFGFAISYSLMLMGFDVGWNLGGFALAVGTVLGVVSMAPAGVGGAEGTMWAILTGAGVASASAFIITMLARLMVIWIPVGVGFMALPWALQAPDATAGSGVDMPKVSGKVTPSKRKIRS